MVERRKETREDIVILTELSTKMEIVLDTVKGLAAKLENKVDVSSFEEIKKDVEDLKKGKWLAMGFAGAISWVVSHLGKL